MIDIRHLGAAPLAQFGPAPGCDDQHLGCQAKEVTLACNGRRAEREVASFI